MTEVATVSTVGFAIHSGPPSSLSAGSAEDAREVAMHAIAVNEYGADPALVELPTPRPEPGQILIKIRSAGMNPGDLQIANGAWKDRVPAPFRSCSESISRAWSHPQGRDR